MSGEEGPPEDRKLSAVKSWFTRSVSFGGVHGSSAALAAAAASKGGSGERGHNAGPDQEAWGGFHLTLKQLSMRRSKGGNESYERETALGSPAMTPRNVTPLVPLTPLRWKSSPPELESEQQEKAAPAERSRLGLRVINSGDNKLHTQGIEAEPKEHPDDPVHATTPFAGFYSINAQTTATEAQDAEADESSAMESPLGEDSMKASPGEDVMTMTIDFLRARLLAERSASTSAKERIQELSRKVMELELKLEQVVDEKNKVENSAEEALLKLLTGDFAQVADCTARAAQSRAEAGLQLHVTTITSARSGSGGEDVIKEELQRAGSSVSIGDFSRTASIASSFESKDSKESSRRTLSQPGTTESDAANAEHAADLWVTPKNMFVSDGESPKKQPEKRAAIENRLRSMWSQLSADMSALAGDGSHEQLMNWMDQVPVVLQKRFPQTSAEDMASSQDSQLLLSPPEGIIQDLKVHVRAQSEAEIMLEEYEAHKRVQREWERNYYESKQRLEQSKAQTTNQPDDNAGMDYYHSSKDYYGPKESVGNSAMPHLGAHPHLLYSNAQKLGFRSDFASWGGDDQHGRNTTMDGRNNNDNNNKSHGTNPVDHQQLRLAHHQQQAECVRVHEPESRDWQQENSFQQPGSQGVRRQIGYPGTHPERDVHGRAYVTWSAEDPFRNFHHGNGGAHPMWDYRDIDQGSLGPTHTNNNDCRARERDSDPYRNDQQSEKLYRHAHHQSRSADSSNWPTEEDNRGMKNPEKETAPTSFGNRDLQQSSYKEDLQPTHNNTRHQQDTYLDTKTNGPGQHIMRPQANPNVSAKAETEPKLYLGYGPAYDAPREPLHQDQVNNKSITNVLLALQKAKASIQKSGAQHVPYTGIISKYQPRVGSEPPWTHYTRITEHDVGATRQRPSNSSPSLNFNPSAMRQRQAAAHGHQCSYVDQLNVGKGIDFFF